VAISTWWILVTAAGEVLDGDLGWKRLLRRALLISLGTWVLVPFLVCWGLAWWAGEDVFSGKNVGVLVGIFLIWAMILVVPCWVAAMGYERLRKKEI
jgi:hypothetical protein